MNTQEWLLAQLQPDAPGFWLLIDIAAGVALWFLGRLIPRRWRNLSTVGRWVLPAWLALIAGALSPQQMGLSGNNWDTGLRIGLGFVVAMLALLGLARLALREGEPDEGESNGAAQSLYTVLHRGAEQFHWCFQRAAVLALLISAPSALDSTAYWAMWGATVLALPGIFTTPGSAAKLYSTVALASTAILFFYTRNFWLCWALHAGIMLIAGVPVEPGARRSLTAAGNGSGFRA